MRALEYIDSFEDYYNHSAKTAVYPEAGTKSLMEIAYLGLGLAGEAGESVDVIKKIVRDGSCETLADRDIYAQRKSKLKEELGDTLWYMGQIMRVYGWTLEEVLSENVEKLAIRYANNEVKNHG